MVSSSIRVSGLVGALSIPMAINTAINVTIGSKWLVALRRAQVRRARG